MWVHRNGAEQGANDPPYVCKWYFFVFFNQETLKNAFYQVIYKIKRHKNTIFMKVGSLESKVPALKLKKYQTLLKKCPFSSLFFKGTKQEGWETFICVGSQPKCRWSGTEPSLCRSVPLAPQVYRSAIVSSPLLKPQLGLVCMKIWVLSDCDPAVSSDSAGHTGLLSWTPANCVCVSFSHSEPNTHSRRHPALRRWIVWGRYKPGAARPSSQTSLPVMLKRAFPGMCVRAAQVAPNNRPDASTPMHTQHTPGWRCVLANGAIVQIWSGAGRLAVLKRSGAIIFCSFFSVCRSHLLSYRAWLQGATWSSKKFGLLITWVVSSGVFFF